MFSPKQKLKQIQKPDMADTLENLKQDIFKTINCVQIGYVESFNTADQTAVVRLAIKKIKDITLDGRNIIEEQSLLLSCPAFILGGDSYISAPIKKGDSCIVLFNDRDIDNWFIDGNVAIPNTRRTHDLSDAFALVGIRNTQQSIQNFDNESLNVFFSEVNNIKINDTLNMLATTPLLTVTGELSIGGAVTQKDSNPLIVDADVTQQAGKVLKAGNGATGTFTSQDGKSVTVQDGIIVSII
jgi:hypothetical protein